MRPSERALRGAEGTAALDAMRSEPEAVGAYDHVPFASATAVFLMDTASEVFVIHRAQVPDYIPPGVLLRVAMVPGAGSNALTMPKIFITTMATVEMLDAES